MKSNNSTSLLKKNFTIDDSEPVFSSTRWVSVVYSSVNCNNTITFMSDCMLCSDW
jgi:hypothetical protein